MLTPCSKFMAISLVYLPVQTYCTDEQPNAHKSFVSDKKEGRERKKELNLHTCSHILLMM